jgi:squalene-hopene/tetraprenyl-beta-curcumene cyclase
MTEIALVDNLRATHARLRERLLAERHADGYWTGELSSSALATATAVSALSLADGDRYRALTEAGCRWLVANQNADGGWGDTTDSPSHLATTLLCQAALVIAGLRDTHGDAFRRAEVWVTAHAGSSAEARAAAVGDLYGKDRTFAVPILMNSALAGRADWQSIPPLPFELACIPHRGLRLFRAHVVSYALPALIAIGQLLHQKHPTRNPLLKALRGRLITSTLARLEAIQPATGGFIEAVPLTSFVVMSLAAAGRRDHTATARGCDFLERSARADGSWPIDSNLSLWLTTAAARAMAAGSDAAPGDLAMTLEWIADRQHTAVHPFTQSAPGGWAWTHLAGGVPDVDDTAGALVALGLAGATNVPERTVRDGVVWLLDLQNSNGGWPTFCRGWGRLEFDRSAPDLTAHALRALTRWADRGPRRRTGRAIRRGLAYLSRTQREDGSWLPLWFGNQHTADHTNPVLGTARVLAAYADMDRLSDVAARRGALFLLSAQNDDGGWGGTRGTPSSLEETAMAVEALSSGMAEPAVRDACLAGGRHMLDRIDDGAIDNPSPIGLYFTRLWYGEKLYPLVWTVGALGRLLATLDSRATARCNWG